MRSFRRHVQNRVSDENDSLSLSLLDKIIEFLVLMKYFWKREINSWSFVGKTCNMITNKHRALSEWKYGNIKYSIIIAIRSDMTRITGCKMNINTCSYQLIRNQSKILVSLSNFSLWLTRLKRFQRADLVRRPTSILIIFPRVDRDYKRVEESGWEPRNAFSLRRFARDSLNLNERTNGPERFRVPRWKATRKSELR